MHKAVLTNFLLAWLLELVGLDWIVSQCWHLSSMHLIIMISLMLFLMNSIIELGVA